jgi:CubicO group peptidase (beta-lactamase class C family)
MDPYNLVQSVAGGAHWGGGMIINSRDMARFGYLTLRKGKWGDKQILSEEWLRIATTPGAANNAFGNVLTVRGSFLRAPTSLVVIVPRDDLQVSLGGRLVSLSDMARRTGGPLELRAGGVTLQASAADIQVWRDSIAIHLRSQSP